MTEQCEILPFTDYHYNLLPTVDGYIKWHAEELGSSVKIDRATVAQYLKPFHEHDCTKQVVKHIYSNGTTHYAIQCLVCGEREAIKKSDARINHAVEYPLIDLALQTARLHEMNQWSDEIYLPLHEREQGNHKRIRRNEYEAYLSTKQWRMIRERVLKRDRRLCQACLVAQATQVHHYSYPQTLGTEPCFTLTSVCAPCHKSLHTTGGVNYDNQ